MKKAMGKLKISSVTGALCPGMMKSFRRFLCSVNLHRKWVLMAYFPDWECNWHLMFWYLAANWKVVGGPFCGLGLLLKKVPWHEGASLSSYSTDLASEEHTRPYQTSVWQPCCCGFCWERSRSLKLATDGLAPRNRSDVLGRRPDHVDQRIRDFGAGQYWFWQYLNIHMVGLLSNSHSYRTEEMYSNL